MLPLIMAAISLAQKKAQNEQNAINQLNQKRLNYNGQPQQMNMVPQQSNGIGGALGSISSIYGTQAYGSFGK